MQSGVFVAIYSFAANQLSRIYNLHTSTITTYFFLQRLWTNVSKSAHQHHKPAVLFIAYDHDEVGGGGATAANNISHDLHWV